MKKIGLIGGMSWESSLEYYRLLNELVKSRLGGFHSANCIMESVDFAEIERQQHNDNWDSLSALMVEAAKNLEAARADCIVLCTNTMHICHRNIVANVDIPFLHIAEAAGERIKSAGLEKVLLIGTRFTMEKDFFKDYITSRFAIDIITPDKPDRDIIHRVIYDELVNGEIYDSSRKAFVRIIEDAVREGARGVILGCTEIPLLIKDKDVSIPVFDTTTIHAEFAVDFALQNPSFK